jgi:hypothetical protein
VGVGVGESAVLRCHNTGTHIPTLALDFLFLLNDFLPIKKIYFCLFSLSFFFSFLR